VTERVRRVAVVTTSYPRDAGDPAGHFVAAEVEDLVRSGAEVVVIAPAAGRRGGVRSRGAEGGGRGTVRRIEVAAGEAFGFPGALARLRASPIRSVGAARFLLGARSSLRRAGPFDEVIAHWLLPCAWPIAVDAPGALEVVVHGSDAELLLALPRALRDHILASLLARDARFRFVSRALRERLVAVGPPGLAARSSVRPATLAMPDVPGRSAARAALDLGPEETVIVIAGRLLPGKRPLLAVGAATLVPGARVFVVGDGPERSRLEATFPEARLLGALPRPAALTWIAAADLLLSASASEGAPTAIREARQLGVPVVTTPVGDVRDWSVSDPGLTVVTERAAPAEPPGARGRPPR